MAVARGVTGSCLCKVHMDYCSFTLVALVLWTAKYNEVVGNTVLHLWFVADIHTSLHLACVQRMTFPSRELQLKKKRHPFEKGLGLPFGLFQDAKACARLMMMISNA